MGKYKITRDKADTKKSGRRRVLTDNVCVCGVTYRPPSAKTKFCGNECARNNRPKKGINKTCICGNDFYVRPSVIRIRNYCKKSCIKLEPTTKVTLTCKFCAKEYMTHASHIKNRGSSYCSRECLGKHKTILQSGANSNWWKGGISKENHRIRQSQEFKNWRVEVFKRDNYTCVFCGQHGGYLEPDHIKPFAYFHEDRFDINNGRTLCKPCHKTTDTYGHKARLKYEQV